MLFSTISAIRRGTWLLDSNWVQEHASVVVAALEGKASFESIVGKTQLGEDKMPAVAASASGAYKVKYPYQVNNLPNNSVAVIPISGPILREGDCSMGLSDYANALRACESSANIVAIVLDINSPGGEASGTAAFAQLIRNCSKPVVGMVDDGIAASAAMWIGSACKEFYTTTKHSAVGSIGAYCTLADFSEAYAQKGIKLIEIYAPQSKDKNADYKSAMDGDTTAIEARLSELVEAFIGDVKTGRGNRLNAKAGDPFTGKMYSSGEAQKIGLIDGVRTTNEIFSRALELSKKSSSKSTQKPMAQNKQYANIATAAGWEAGHESTEDGVHLTHADAAAIDTALSAGTQAATDLATAQTRVTELEAANTALTGEKETLTVANQTLTTANVALGKKSAGGTVLTTATDVVTEETPNAPKAMDPVTAQAQRYYERNNPKKD